MRLIGVSAASRSRVRRPPGCRRRWQPHSTSTRVAEMDEAEWRRAMDVNVTGSFLVCKHAIPAIIAAGGGNIILMASQMATSNTPAVRLLHDTPGGAPAAAGHLPMKEEHSRSYAGTWSR